jgi:hypothetical protein
VKKAHKKIENLLRVALTEVCEVATHEVAGFKWLTHFVNYSKFPESLSVVCVFDTKSDLANLIITHQDVYLVSLIEERLSAADIPVKNISRHVSFDTEEACRDEHGGKWHERFA